MAHDSTQTYHQSISTQCRPNIQTEHHRTPSGNAHSTPKHAQARPRRSPSLYTLTPTFTPSPRKKEAAHAARANPLSFACCKNVANCAPRNHGDRLSKELGLKPRQLTVSAPPFVTQSLNPISAWNSFFIVIALKSGWHFSSVRFSRCQVWKAYHDQPLGPPKKG